MDLFDDLLDDAGPVLERTAVFVGAAIGVGREELLQEIAVRAVQLDAVDARLLAAESTFGEFVFQFVDLPLRQCTDLLALVDGRAGQLGRDAAGGGDGAQVEVVEDLLIEEVHVLRETEEDGPPAVPVAADEVGELPGGDDQLIGLTTRMVELDEDLGAFRVDGVGETGEAGDAAVRGDGQLAGAGAAGPVGDTSDFRLDEAGAAFGALGIVLDTAVAGGAVKLRDFHEHGGQGDAVRDLAVADGPRFEQFGVKFTHNMRSFHLHFSCTRKNNYFYYTGRFDETQPKIRKR